MSFAFPNINSQGGRKVQTRISLTLIFVRAQISITLPQKQNGPKFKPLKTSMTQNEKRKKQAEESNCKIMGPQLLYRIYTLSYYFIHWCYRLQTVMSYKNHILNSAKLIFQYSLCCSGDQIILCYWLLFTFNCCK